MYQRRTGSYDEIPEGMQAYINNYGCHFNKKLYEEAVRRMYKEDEDGREEEIKPYTKEQVERMLDGYGIKLKRNKLYDACYVAAMAKSDYLGSSVVDEKHLALFIKDTIDDADAVDGLVFNRWYADQIFMDQPIEWSEML